MFPTNIWTALFEKETWKEKPPRLKLVKCREFEGRIRWNESCPFHDITEFTLTLLESSENRDFFREQIWSCNRRDSFVWDTTHPRETGRRNIFMIKNDLAHDSVENDLTHDLSKKMLHMTYWHHFPESTKWSGTCLAGKTVGCDNGIGGFHQNLVTFERTDLPLLWWAQKMRLKKCSSEVQ